MKWSYRLWGKVVQGAEYFIIHELSCFVWYCEINHNEFYGLLMYSYSYNFIPQVPDLSFPMEILNGATLHGSVPGSVYGDTYLTTGIAGNALYLGGSGKYVDFGVHPARCFYDPEACTNGVTFSLWLLVNSWGIVFDTGGHGIGSRGYFLRRRKRMFGGTMMAQVRTNSRIETYIGPTIPLAEWKHIVLTWSRGNGMRSYLNGCDADPDGRHGYYQNQTHADSVMTKRSFFLGRNTLSGQYGNQIIDELYIWHEVFQPAQVW